MSYKTVNIDTEIHKEFKIFCSEKGVKMVNELEKIIKQHIEKERNNKWPSKMHI